MSLPITILLLLVTFASAVMTLRLFRRLSADSAFWGIIFGFIIAVTAALVTDFHNPNGGPALLAGLIAALAATPVSTAVAHFVRRLTRR